MRTVFLDCTRFPEPTVATIDQISRLKLASRREGCRLKLKNESAELEELIRFVGLGGVLGLQTRGKAKQRKQPCRIEEESELGDPPAG